MALMHASVQADHEGQAPQVCAQIQPGSCCLARLHLRGLDVAHCRLQLSTGTICSQVFGVEEGIDTINDTYWTLRVEPTPADQLQLMPHDRLIHVYHVTLDAQQHVSQAA